MRRRPQRSTLFPDTTRFRSRPTLGLPVTDPADDLQLVLLEGHPSAASVPQPPTCEGTARKSTRLNSSHANISYAVFCLKKKNPSSTTTYLEHTFTAASTYFS